MNAKTLVTRLKNKIMHEYLGGTDFSTEKLHRNVMTLSTPSPPRSHEKRRSVPSVQTE